MDETVDLSFWADQTVTLTFSTGAGPNGMMRTLIGQAGESQELKFQSNMISWKNIPPQSSIPPGESRPSHTR